VLPPHGEWIPEASNNRASENKFILDHHTYIAKTTVYTHFVVWMIQRGLH